MVFFLFFVSGFTALIFEVVWAKEACLIFGNTTFASAAVIGAFMTGLAFGSFIFGRLADLKPGLALKGYAVLEGIIGVFAVVFPWIVQGLGPIYRSIYIAFYQDFWTLSLIRFILSFVILAVPTICMGGTLPLLARFLNSQPSHLGRDVSRLYAMNLFGAMTGTFASGFVLIACLGLRTTSWLAAALNLGIFLVVMSVMIPKQEQSLGADERGDHSEAAPEADTEKSLEKKAYWILGTLMVFHGLSAFVVQICWTRTMALILGSSTYSFSAVLTTFLAGLGLGTWLVSEWVKRNRKFSLHALGFMEMAMGGSVLMFIPVFEWLIYFFVRIFPVIKLSIFFVFAVEFVFCAIAMIIPATLMGLIFPATLAYWGRQKDIGNKVGWMYALNTTGAVLGCVLSTFVFIAHFGINGSLRFVSVLSVGVGGWVALMSLGAQGSRRYLKKIVAAGLALSLFLFYPWDKNLFSSGVFMYANSWEDKAKLGKSLFQKAIRQGGELLYYKEGISSTVSVLQHSAKGGLKSRLKSKSIRVNGKTDASTIGDMATQLYLGYIPLFAHPNPKEVLVIGLGAGITLGTVTQFPSVKSIECVEIEPAVIEANRFFTVENNYALKDPRLRLIVGDGRNHIRFSQKKYDVIISEPSNPWISGVSSLFTKENYASALSKLKPEGIYCQWFHSYQMSKEDFVMIIQTFASVFPQVNLYRVGGNDYFLLGSRQNIRFDYSRMMKLVRENPRTQSDLKYFTDHEENFVLGSFLLSNRDLRRAVSEEAPRLNTDDRLHLEYQAPKYLYRPTSQEIFEWLHSLHREDFFPEFENWDREKILNSPNVWKIFFANGLQDLRAKNYDDALYFLKEAARLKPDEFRIYYALGGVYESKKQYPQAIQNYLILKEKKGWAERVGSAVRRCLIKQKMEENPLLQRDVELHNLIGSLSYLMKENEEAIRSLKLAMDLDPGFVKNYTDLAMIYFSEGDESAGLDLLGRAARLDASYPGLKIVREMWKLMSKRTKVQNLLRQGMMYLSVQDFKKARTLFRKVLEMEPNNPLTHQWLARAERKLGLTASSREHSRAYRKLSNRPKKVVLK